MKKLICLIAILTLCFTTLFMSCACGHKHVYEEGWTYDETTHWHKAMCRHSGKKSGEKLHDFDDGIETDEGIVYTCNTCGCNKVELSKYMVTSEVYPSIIGSVDNFEVNVIGGNFFCVISDVMYLESLESNYSEYFAYNGEEYVHLYSSVDGNGNQVYVEDIDSKKTYDANKQLFNYVVDLAGKFSSFSYSATTRTYTADAVIVEHEGSSVTLKNVTLAFENRKLVSAKLTTLIYNGFDEDEWTFEYSKIGSAGKELPENIHKHTYPTKWSYGSSFHYHESDCGHYSIIDKQYHTFEKGVCTVCGYNVLSLSADGKTVMRVENNTVTSFTFPQGVSVIGENAFQNLNITEIVIPEGIQSINNGAFSDCKLLTKVVLPQSITYIGYSAFRDCKKLKDINIPEGLLSVGEAVFEGCNSLTTITLPSTLTEVCAFMFRSCENLTTVNLTEGIKVLNAMLFMYCNSITEIVIPKSVIDIDVDLISYSSVSKIYYKGNQAEWEKIDHVNNLLLDSAQLYFFSATQPTEAGNFWHYVDGEPMAW